MIVAGIYSFKNGQAVIESKYRQELEEITRIVASVESEQHRVKVSKEKTMPGKMLYNPRSLNRDIKSKFEALGWQKYRVACDYPTQYYTPNYQPQREGITAYREIDFIKNRLGVEVQFGKYAFMVYNVCAKMTIFHNFNMTDAGIEVVPVKEFAKQMSTGVSYFEQFVWDLEQRGTADIDSPVLILGIARG